MTFRTQLFNLFNIHGSANFSTAELAERFKCSIATALRYRNEWYGLGKDTAVKVSEFPTQTLAGVMWRQPVEPPGVYRGDNVRCSCDNCSLIELCKRAVWCGDFIGCEQALESEII